MTLSGKYRINIKPGLFVKIEERYKTNSILILGVVKEVITKSPYHDLGILVQLENGIEGRVKEIPDSSSILIVDVKTPFELITLLEIKLRKLIVDELSRDDPNWWNNKIKPTIRENAELKHSKNNTKKKLLQIPDYELIEETDFMDLSSMIIADKNWKNNFEQIFHDAKTLFVKLDELSNYRNLPAHSKDITPHIEKKIQVYYDDIVHLIEYYQRK